MNTDKKKGAPGRSTPAGQKGLTPQGDFELRLILLGWILLCVPSVQAQSVRVIRFSEGKPFQMGKVTSRRIVHPDVGAKNTTLNYSVSQNGSEFSQHVHDHSDDTILVLQGQMDLRQGDSRVPY